MSSLLGTLAASAFMLVFLALGLTASFIYMPRERFAARALIGGAAGLALMMWLPALCAFFMGFTAAAQWLAAGAAAATLCALLFFNRRNISIAMPAVDKGMFFCVAPCFLLCMFMLSTHTLLPKADGTLTTGQSTYGDMSMHLGIITSIARQGFFPPEYSILPGARMNYPFLCDSVSSSLYVLGAPLRFAYIAPMALALMLVFAGGYALASRICGDASKARLAFVLFFLNGGFGLFYFLDGTHGLDENFYRIFTAYYETPTNLLSSNVRWVNVMVDMLIPQRATAMGWALLFTCLYLLYRACFEGERRAFIPLALLAGALPMIHTHSFLALAVLSFVFMIVKLADKWDIQLFKGFMLYAGAALILALPQLLTWTFTQTSADGFVRLHSHWGNKGDNPIWFYVKNIGLPALLFIPAALNARKKGLMLLCGAVALWALCEFVVFQPNPYDNNKLLYVAYFFICCTVASFMVSVYRALKDTRGRLALAAVAIALCTASALLTIGRELVSSYDLFAPAHVEAARYIEANTPPDAVFLTSDNHNNTVACLTGRSIVVGSDSYLYYHGLESAAQRDAMKAMYTESGSFEALARDYGVSYVFVSDYERMRFDIPDGQFDGLNRVFDNGTITIYKVMW